MLSKKNDMILLSGDQRLSIEVRIMYLKSLATIMEIKFDPLNKERLDHIEYCIENNLPIEK